MIEIFKKDYRPATGKPETPALVCVHLEESVPGRVKEMCSGSSLLICNFYSTVLSILLYRYCPEPEDSFVSYFAAPGAAGIRELDFSNRAIDPGMTFKEWFSVNKQEIRRQLQAANGQALSRGERGIPARDGITAIFTEGQELSSLLERPGLSVIVSAGDSSIKLVFPREKYLDGLLELFAHNFNKAITSAIENPNVFIRDLDINSDRQRELMSAFNAGREDSGISGNIVSLWEDNVRRYEQKLALQQGDICWTYGELNIRANRLAVRLSAEADAGNYGLTGILMQRGVMMIQCVLAVWKSGMAYMPLDPGYPAEKLRQLIEDAGLKMVLVDGSVDTALFDSLSGLVHLIRVDELSLEDCPPVNPENRVRLSDLAYVIYTSGSTGRPKGAMIEHFGMLNHILAKVRELEIDENSIVAQNAAHTFDISVWQSFAALMTGGATIIYGNELILAPHSFLRAVQKDKITMLELVPSYLIELLEVMEDAAAAFDLRALKYLVMNAETLTPSMVERWWAIFPAIPVVNTYGATEASDDISHYIMRSLPPTPTIPVLYRPIQNFEVFVVGEDMSPVPIGARGEILIAGPGVGRGYYNDPERSAAAFLQGPLPGMTDAARIYRTGDWGRYLPDGTMEFIGRKDNQVKIGGHRIEPGEVEHTLSGIRGISGVVVIPDAGLRFLIAYYTGDADPDALPSVVAGKLQEYMRPAYFIRLDKFPLTPNGKIDKKALPPPVDRPFAGPEAAAGNNSILEEQLLNIWKKLLKLDRLDIHRDFFLSGGQSIKAFQLINKYRTLFGVRLSMEDLFTHSTIAQQARLIKEKTPEDQDIIASVNIAPDYEVSDGQRRIWVLSQMEDTSRAYNLPGRLIWEGRYDAAIFETTIRRLIERHEILRTIFTENDKGQVRQKVLESADLSLEIPFRDLSGRSLQELDDIIREGSLEPFPLDQAPLFRIGLIQRGPDSYVLHYTMHHIISDGWSMELIGKEIMTIYAASLKGEEAPLPPLRIQYKDYSAWQRRQVNGDMLLRHRDYWLKMFDGDLPVLDLASYRPRPPIMTHNGYGLYTLIDKGVAESLRSLCDSHHATLFMALLSALNALLYRYTGQGDIIIGTPVAGRHHVDLENQVGFYVNTLALRTRFSGEDSFEELLQNVKATTLSAYDHQSYPFDRLIDELQLRRSTDRSALFDAMLVLQNRQETLFRDNTMPGAADSITDYGEVKVKFDLLFNVEEVEEGITLYVEYNTDIYDRGCIAGLMQHFSRLLKAIVHQPFLKIRQLEYLPEKEKLQLLEGFNDTDTSYPAGDTIISMFARQADALRGKTAIEQEGRKLTFGELDEYSNLLACYLVSKGVCREMPVPVCMERSIGMVAGLLAIMKAGAAYVPVDPAYPRERIAYIMQDTGATVILTDQSCMNLIDSDKGYSVVLLDSDREAIINQSPPDRMESPRPENLAYVIYTSGSTGKPKGVMVEHRSVVNLIAWHMQKYQVDASCRSTAMAGVGFDAAALEIWSALLSGSTLYIVPDEIRIQGDLLLEFYHTNAITHAFVPPALIPDLIDRPQPEGLALRYVLIGGDRLLPPAVSNLSYTLVNQYGPTEATVMVTDYPFRDGLQGQPPIGKPLANTRLYVLDGDLNLLPAGAVGELFIGGTALARGYWNSVELTKEKFLTGIVDAEPVLYRTGDLVRWLPDGNMQYVGRRDDQVKVRGYRIEPGEIEQCLLRHEAVTAAIVLVNESREGERSLAAYIACSDAVLPAGIKDFLRDKLPFYMIPAHFIPVSKMPLTNNGKIDRVKLRQLQPPTIHRAAPANQLEKELAALIAVKLDRDEKEIGMEDNFFDLGMNSLSLVQLVRLINERFGKDLKILALFQHPNIRSLVDNYFREGQSPAVVVPEGTDLQEELDAAISLFAE